MHTDGLCCWRSERIRAGQARARAAGKQIGRPRKVLCPDFIIDLREQGLSWRAIARRMGVGLGTVRRAVGLDASSISASQNYLAGKLQAPADPQDGAGVLGIPSLGGRDSHQQPPTLLSGDPPGRL